MGTMTHARKRTVYGRCVLDRDVDRTSTADHYESCRNYEQRRQASIRPVNPIGSWATSGPHEAPANTYKPLRESAPARDCAAAVADHRDH